MYILAIETTGAFASVALAEAEWESGKVTKFDVIGHIEGHDKFSHLQNLTPQIERLMKENGSQIDDVDVIAVSCGPGSFTGIRIGISTGRALSQVLGIPCVSVPSLDAQALRYAAKGNEIICPIIDARRNQIYGGGFCMKERDDAIGREVEAVIPAGPYTVEELMNLLAPLKNNMIVFMGDGIDKYGELIAEFASKLEMDLSRMAIAEEAIRYQDANTVALLGASLAAEDETCGFEELKPEYMRQAEAERKLKEKQKNG